MLYLRRLHELFRLVKANELVYLVRILREHQVEVEEVKVDIGRVLLHSEIHVSEEDAVAPEQLFLVDVLEHNLERELSGCLEDYVHSRLSEGLQFFQ